MKTLYTSPSKIDGLLDTSSALVQFVTESIDYTSSGSEPLRVISSSNGTTPVNISGSPASNYKRIINYISAYNADTSNKEVTIRFNDSVNTCIEFKVVLAPGEKLEYNYEKWSVYNSIGAIKNSLNQGANAPTSNLISTVVLGVDVVNNNAVANTMQDVTGLSFNAENGKTYWFKFVIPYTSAATTTGSRWGVNASAGTAATLSYTSEYSLTSTTTTRNANVQAFDSPASANASSAATGNNLCIMEGYFKPTADCVFIARFASEISASAITAKSGAILYYQKTN